MKFSSPAMVEFFETAVLTPNERRNLMVRMSKYRVAALSLFALATLPAMADDIGSAANDLCEKVKACSIAQIEEQDLTPELRKMMEPMLESMCDAVRQGVQEVPRGHELYDPAVACMRSMAGLSCEDFQDDTKVETDACKKYQSLAETYDGS